MNFIGGENEMGKTEYDFECDLFKFIKGQDLLGNFSKELQKFLRMFFP